MPRLMSRWTSRLIGTTAVRHAVVGLALAGAAGAIATAQAGDLAPPAPMPYPYQQGYQPMYGHGEPCRIVIERRLDPYGREIVHRIRMCDEGPVYVAPSEAAAPLESPPEYGYPPPRPYYAPSPSGYETYPRPPAPIGEGYYN
jgi:hypothetical protein